MTSRDRSFSRFFRSPLTRAVLLAVLVLLCVQLVLLLRIAALQPRSEVSQAVFDTFCKPSNLTFGTLKLKLDGDVVLCSQGPALYAAAYERAWRFWTGPISVVFHIGEAQKEASFDAVRRTSLMSRPNTLVQFHIVCVADEDEARYPSNALRNMAIRAVPEWNAVFVVDPGFLVSSGSYEYFSASLRLLRRNSHKVLVVPCFELREKVNRGYVSLSERKGSAPPKQPPHTFVQLADAANNGFVRQCGHGSFPQAHCSTDYARWWAGSDFVPWSLPKFDAGYEPFFVALRTLHFPSYDERIRGWGGDRGTFLAALYDDGYDFYNIPRGIFVLYVASKDGLKQTFVNKARAGALEVAFDGLDRAKSNLCVQRHAASVAALQPLATRLRLSFGNSEGILDEGIMLNHVFEFSASLRDQHRLSCARDCKHLLVTLILVAGASGAVSERILEATLSSLMQQSYDRLEIIVVVDSPSNSLFDFVYEISGHDLRVRIVHNIRQKGLVWSTNYGLSIATGDFVAIIEEGTIAHAHRFRTQMEHFCKGTLEASGVAARGNHAVIMGNGAMLIAEKSWTSLVFRRAEVLATIGYLVELPGSQALAEWYSRLHVMYCNNTHSRIFDLQSVLSFAVGYGTCWNLVTGLLSPRKIEWNVRLMNNWISWHESWSAGGVSLRVPFPQLMDVLSRLRLKLNHAETIFAGIAAIPTRRRQLELAVASLLPQVDGIGVHLNNWDDVPDFLIHPKISVTTSQQYGDRNDLGKFFALRGYTGYYFSCDDDLIYPPDYVRNMVRKIELYARKALIGVHGTIFLENWTRYFACRTRSVLHFKEWQMVDSLVDVIGTGTLAFHTETIRGLKMARDLTHPGMADVDVAVWAKRHHVPLVSVARPHRWVVPAPGQMANETNLYNLATKGRDSIQTSLIRQNGVDQMDPEGPEVRCVRSVFSGHSARALRTQDIDLSRIVPRRVAR